jgi:asparagine synthase (glutamine-hydrolysing)
VNQRYRSARRKLADWIALSRLRYEDASAHKIITRVLSHGLTFLSPAALVDLYRAVRRIESQGLPGVILEAGCAQGGSAIVMAAAKSAVRPFYVYDAFGMIPPPTDQDDQDAHARYDSIVSGQAVGPQGATYYGYEPDLLAKVRAHFDQCGYPVDQHHISLVKGLYQDALQVDQPVALAHLDCDWYDSVMICLRRIVPHLAPGGVLVIDDYADWAGCRKAVDEYFAGRRGQYKFRMKSRLHIQRRPA